MKHIFAFLLGLCFTAFSFAATTLSSGGILLMNQGLTASLNGYGVRLTDVGSFTVFRIRDQVILYQSPALPTAVNPALYMSANGALEIRSANGVDFVIRDTGIPGAYAVMEDSGSFSIYSPTPANSLLWGSGEDAIASAPTEIADVLGRNLDVTLAGFAGHIGLWDGSQVVEVINSQPVIRRTSLSAFKTASDAYWGKATVSLPVMYSLGCAQLECYDDGAMLTDWVAYRPGVILRTQQIEMIGLQYTLTPYPTQARPTVYRGGIVDKPGQPGIYRCDTFVIDAMKTWPYGTFSASPTEEGVGSLAIGWWMSFVNFQLGQPETTSTPSSVFDQLLNFYNLFPI
jgi:hypothetical protein